MFGIIRLDRQKRKGKDDTAETAAYVFNDANRIEMYDDVHSIDENRYYTIGMVGEILL